MCVCGSIGKHATELDPGRKDNISARTKEREGKGDRAWIQSLHGWGMNEEPRGPGERVMSRNGSGKRQIEEGTEDGRGWMEGGSV